MYTKKSWYLLMCICFTLSESFSVDSLQKCSVKDYECQRDFYQNVIKVAGKPGIPELGIPPLDPIVLKNVAVVVLDVLNLTLVDGVAKGIKNCVVNHLKIDIEKGISTQNVTCDFVIKGQYSLYGDSEILKRLFGSGGVRGNGKGKAQLEKLVLDMKFPFYPVKHDDGEIYFKLLGKDVEYNYDIKDKASFAADNIYLGKEDVSEFVVKYLNENWKYILKTFGRAFVDKAIEYYFDFAQKFFDNVPAKHIMIEDLTPYLRD